MSGLRTTPKQDRGWETIELLRKAAVELYNDSKIGRDRLRLQDVAAHSNVSIGTIYRYWPNRLAMLDDIAPNRDQSPLPTGSDISKKSADEDGETKENRNEEQDRPHGRHRAGSLTDAGWMLDNPSREWQRQVNQFLGQLAQSSQELAGSDSYSSAG